MLVLLIAPGAASGAPIDHLERASPISSFGATAAWSRFSTADGLYRLTIFHDGQITEPAVPARAVPFDVDLGPGPNGQTLAVYSRCRREPELSAFPTIFAWRSASGCDLYALDVASGREWRLRSASRAGSSEYMPSVWGRRVAFARRSDRRRSKAPLALIVSDLNSSKGTLPLSTPTLGLTGSPGPTHLDLHGHRVAYIWDNVTKRVNGGIRGYSSTLWVASLTGERRRLDQTSWPDLMSSFLFSPTISGSWVVYAFENNERAGRFVAFRRVRVTGGRVVRRRRPTNQIPSLRWHGLRRPQRSRPRRAAARGR